MIEDAFCSEWQNREREDRGKNKYETRRYEMGEWLEKERLIHWWKLKYDW